MAIALYSDARELLGDTCGESNRPAYPPPPMLLFLHARILRSMTIEDADVINAIARDEQSKTVVLLISDHLDWSNVKIHLEKV